MKNVGYYNGKIDTLENLTVPVLDRAVYFGDAVYDVVFVHNRVPYSLDLHLDRFFRSCNLIEITPAMTKAEMKDLLYSLLDKVDDGDCSIYFQYSRSTGFRLHNYDREAKPNFLVMIKPGKIKPKGTLFRTLTAEDKRYSFCNIKTINLIPNVMATTKAADADCDECIFIRDGMVTECSHSNVHVLKDGALWTHPADCHILPGIARIHLIEEAKKLGIPVKEEEFTEAFLMDADEILITSTSILCVRVNEVNGKKVGMKDTVTFEKLENAVFEDFYAKTEG